jgi:hypothetical protein
MRFNEIKKLMEKGLTGAELRKPSAKKPETKPEKDDTAADPQAPRFRYHDLIDLIKNTATFVLVGGGEVQLANNNEQIQAIKDYFNNKTNKPLILTTTDGKRISSGKLLKTKEFKGEPTNYRLKIQIAQTDSMNKAIEAAKKGQPFIPIQLRKDVSINVAAAKPTPGNVKSDVTLIDEKGNELGWVSLKDSRSFKWGGFSHLKNSIIQTFVNRVRTILKGENREQLNPDECYGIHVNDTDLIQKIIYGKDFGSEKSGPSNIDLVILGTPIIEKNGNVFSLKGSTTYIKGMIPTGKDELYLSIRYTSDRSNYGIKFSRAEAAPISDARARKVKWLDDDPNDWDIDNFGESLE